jgi:hypothetical protein
MKGDAYEESDDAGRRTPHLVRLRTVMKRRPTTLLWSTVEGVECRMAPYEDDRYQVMLRWRDETIKATVVRDYAGALAMSREWRRERDASV